MRTYKITKTSNGYIIEGANHKSVVLSRRPRGPSLLDRVPPKVFDTEAKAREYMEKHNMQEAI